MGTKKNEQWLSGRHQFWTAPRLNPAAWEHP